MKRLSLLTCVLLATSASALAQDQTAGQKKQAELSTWKTYTVEGEGFSVSLPTLPAMTTYATFIKKLNKTQRDRMLGVYADGAVYSVYVYENLGRKLFDDFIAEHSNDLDAATETNVQANGFKGKQYAGSNKIFHTTTQFFAAEGRLYTFSVGGDFVEDAAAKQFFSSIVLGKTPDGIRVQDGPGLPFEEAPGEQVFLGRDVTRKVRLFMKPEPQYTELARQEQTTGTVFLKAVFSSAGSVKSIQVVKELPNGLTEKAIDATKKIKFLPAMKDGKYVSMWIQLEYNFNLY